MSSSPPGRILSLDVGSKTIGLAVSDPLGLTAQGLETIRRKNKRTDFEQLRQVIARYEVREIVVGNPLHMSGDASPQSRRVSEFAEEVRQRFNLPVHMLDERLTFTQANRVLRESEMRILRRAEIVDRLASVVTLLSVLA